MHITRAMADARDAQAVYFLLTAYLEAVGNGDANGMPAQVVRLPVHGIDDVIARVRVLSAAGTVANVVLTERCAGMVTEGLAVFRSAAARLNALGRGSGEAPARERAAA